jgi:hypothetical protein
MHGIRTRIAAGPLALAGGVWLDHDLGCPPERLPSSRSNHAAQSII